MALRRRRRYGGSSGTSGPVDLTSIVEALARGIAQRVEGELAVALLATPLPSAPRRCGREGCGGAFLARGLCRRHYNMMRAKVRKRE